MDSCMRHEDSAQVWLEPVELRVWSFSECNWCGKNLKFSGFFAQIVEKKTNTIARGHGRNRLLESSRGNIACTDRPRKKPMELRWLYLRSTEAQQIGNLTFGPRLDSWIFKQPSFMPLWGQLQNLSMLLSKKGVPLRGMKGFFGISEVCGSELRNREEAAAELAKILQPESKAHGLAPSSQQRFDSVGDATFASGEPLGKSTQPDPQLTNSGAQRWGLGVGEVGAGSRSSSSANSSSPTHSGTSTKGCQGQGEEGGVPNQASSVVFGGVGK